MFMAVKRFSFLRLRRAAGTFPDLLDLSTPDLLYANGMGFDPLRSYRWWTVSPCVNALYNRGRLRRH